jgi:hypothetical protein
VRREADDATRECAGNGTVLGTLRDALARGTKVLVTDSVTYDHMLAARPVP